MTRAYSKRTKPGRRRVAAKRTGRDLRNVMRSSGQPDDYTGASRNSRELHAAAMKAFSTAQAIANARPQPGSDEWREWVRLSNEAMQLNDAFLAALAAERALHGKDV